MGRVGSCFDNAAAEAWFSTLEWELLRNRRFATRAEAAREISRWTYEFYNGRRRHSTIGRSSPVRYEHSFTVQAIAAYEVARSGGVAAADERLKSLGLPGKSNEKGPS